MLTAEAPGLAVFRRGKVRDTFELDDSSLLMVATDRISAFDVVLPTPIPVKGQVLTQMSRWWFAETESIVPNHLLSGGFDAACSPRPRVDRLRAALDARSAGRAHRRGVRRPRLSRRQRMEGVPGTSHAGRRGPAPRSVRIGPAAREPFHARDQERLGSRREHQPRPVGRGAGRGNRASPRGDLPRALHPRGPPLRAAWDDPRGHQVRVRVYRRRAHADRRALHSRLVTVLGCHRMAAGPVDAFVRQTTRARLARAEWLGQVPAGTGAASRRLSRAPQRVTATPPDVSATWSFDRWQSFLPRSQ